MTSFLQHQMMVKTNIVYFKKTNLFSADKSGIVKVSILYHIYVLVKNSQSYDCWNFGVGGVHYEASGRMKCTPLENIPILELLI